VIRKSLNPTNTPTQRPFLIGKACHPARSPDLAQFRDPVKPPDSETARSGKSPDQGKFRDPVKHPIQ
jgi:hypothetical protein